LLLEFSLAIILCSISYPHITLSHKMTVWYWQH